METGSRPGKRPASAVTNPAGDEPRPVWRFERLTEFRPPPASVTELARTGLRGLVHRFQDRTPSSPESGDPELPEFASDELEKLVPAPPLDRIVDALSAALPEWLEGSASPKLCVVVEPPPGSRFELVAMLARARRLPILEPPVPNALLNGAEPVLGALERRVDEPLAIPRLERWFLRHPHALGTLRDLFGALALRRGPTLVSCGSWAWTWLRAALQVDALLPEPLVLAPLDAEALASWLGSSAETRVACREPDGKWLLRPGGEDVPGESSDFLRHLAAEARGNPVVARTLWTAALRRPPAGVFDGVDLADGVTRLAAVPWARLARPALGRRARFDEVAVLHSLLLHGGLSTDVLDRVLPFGRAALSRCLAGLSAARLVEAHADEWRVSAPGYPAVRRELVSAGLPADDL